MKEDKVRKAGVYTGIAIPVGTLIVFLVAGMLLVSNTNMMFEPEQKQMWHKVYRWTPLESEGDPGSGASGFLEIFFTNHSTDANASYAQNDSAEIESNCTSNMAGLTPYANADDFDVELESEKSFDIVVRVRFNKTHAWETDKFIGTDCDCQITTSCTSWADGNDESNTSGVRVESRNDTSEDFIWINFVWDADDDGGYQLSDDATLTISEIYIEARY